jgi:hypothetical protein
MIQCRDCKHYNGTADSTGYCALTMVKVKLHDGCDKFEICEGQKT